MNLDPLSQLSYASEANVFVTAASLLVNGNVEILEVHIFNRERMGILVSPHIEVLVFLTVSCVLNYQALVITSVLSLIAASGLLLAIAVRISTRVIGD